MQCFQYSTTTADADPGAGKFRLNNATISSATEMYIDDLEFNGTDVSAWVQSGMMLQVMILTEEE